uniref:Lipoprotein n=1 Tax=Streptomyces sp. NBC_00049 TaxID=2903617 RepID=A0AAU2JNF2_9ACTN
MRTAHRFTATAALACAAALGLTGCFASGPFADLSGSEVADQSVDALRGAASLTVSGKVWDEGKPMELKMAVSKTGDCRGTITSQDGSFELIRNSEFVFINADEPFYRSQTKDLPKEQADDAVKQLAGHWLKSKASDADSKELSALCDLDELLKAFDDSQGAEKGKVTSVDGQKALTLSTKTDEGTETLLVATEGKPYLLKASVDGKEPAELSFSGIDKPVQAEAPAGKDVIDADELG